jgi:hypothetical protein
MCSSDGPTSGSGQATLNYRWEWFNSFANYARIRLFIIDIRYSRETQNPPIARSWGFAPPPGTTLPDVINFDTNLICKRTSLPPLRSTGWARLGKCDTVRIFLIFSCIALSAIFRPGNFFGFGSVTPNAVCAPDHRSAWKTSPSYEPSFASDVEPPELSRLH